MNKRGCRNILLAIFLVALILRVSYVLFFPQAEIRGDAHDYDVIGLNIATGHGFSYTPDIPTSKRAPLYPFFLSIIYFLFGHTHFVVRITQAILGSLTCIILYYVAKEVFDERIAKISSLLLAIYPILIVYCGLLLTETLFTFLLATSILLLIKGIVTTKTKYFIGSSIFLGFGTLTRPVTLLFPFVILTSLVIAKRKLILNWIAFFLIFLITLLPWIFRNYYLFGMYNICSIGTGFGLFITGHMAKGYTFEESFQKYIELAKKFPEPEIFILKKYPDVERERIAQLEGIRLIKENLKNYFIIVMKRLPRFWWTSHSSIFGVDKSIVKYLEEKDYLHLSVRLGLLCLQGIFLLLASIGIVLSLKSRKKNALILILTLIYFTGHIAFDPCPRYHLPAMPYIFVFVSVAVNDIFERIWKTRV